jgi:hypothetical protein
VRLSSFGGIGGDYTGGVTVAAGQVVGSATQEIVVGEADADDGNVEVRIYQPFDIDPLGRINWFQQNVFPAFQSTDIIEAQSVDATGVNVAVGNVIEEPLGTPVVEEIVVGPTGGAPVVRILSGDGIVLREWLAYVPGQNSGTAVAVGDVNGDGIDEVITTPAQGLPWVKVWNGDGTLFIPSGSAEGVSFFAFLTNVTGGLRPTAADVDLDGRAEILVASGPGIDGVVKAFEAATVSGEPVPVQGWTDFKPFGPGSADGLAIASTDGFLRH